MSLVCPGIRGGIKTQCWPLYTLKSRHVGDSTKPRFSKDAADKTGAGERTIQRAVTIANKLDDGVRDTIRHLPIADLSSRRASFAGAFKGATI